ncbi:MAG: GNAT family N-acetyltransferase [Nocardioides sp.]
MSEVVIRPMRESDLEAMQEVSDTTHYESDLRTYQRDWPDPQRRSPAAKRSWLLRQRHFLAADPGGCWVAEGDGRVVGFATSYTRELMWILASFNVATGHQGAGIGTQLLGAAMHHGRGCLRGMLSASEDQGALRRYRQAGFSLHPQLFVWGYVDRSVLPVVEHVRAGTPGDRDLLDSLDRRTRGAAHGDDHAVLGQLFRLVVVDRSTGSGYAYVDDAGAPVLLAATSRKVATQLTWEALAASRPDQPVEVGHITAANEWALDVALAARLEVHVRGHLALRHMKPPAPYLHHGTFL